ncbi:MAG: glycosyltransferase [Candidatus Anstonellaceae archaeon]
MRIAFFTDTYHPTIDGVVRAIDGFQKELEKNGHEVKIFAPAPENEKNKIEGVVYAPSIEFLPYPQYRIAIDTSSCLKEYEKFKPDITHSHAMVLMGLEAKKAAKKFRSPLIGTFHTFLPDAGHYITKNEGLQYWFNNLCWQYLKKFYSDFDGVIAPSEFTKKKLLEKQIACNFVVPSGIDLKLFSQKREKKKYILYFGRVAKEKNLDFLIDLAMKKEFARLNIPIVIAGDGPYKEELEQKIKKNSLNIKMFGKILDSEISKIYSGAYAIFNPSEFETQGLSAIEGMACKTPLVCFKETALEELVKDGGGIACEKDLDQVIEAIEKILQNLPRYSTHAYKTAQKYSIQNSTKKLLEVYKAIL